MIGILASTLIPPTHTDLQVSKVDTLPFVFWTWDLISAKCISRISFKSSLMSILSSFKRSYIRSVVSGIVLMLNGGAFSIRVEAPNYPLCDSSISASTSSILSQTIHRIIPSNAASQKKKSLTRFLITNLLLDQRLPSVLFQESSWIP